MGLSLSLSVPSPGPGYKSWDICPAAESGPAQPQEAGETLGKSAEPFLPPGLEKRCHDATKPTRRACAGGVAPTTLPPVLGPRSGDGLLDETCSSFRPETCWWGEGSPQGSQTSGRQAVGASALLPRVVSQAGPGPSEVLWFSLVPPLPSEPSPPPHPSPLPPMPGSATWV